MTPLRVAVAGAGIGGLTLALALQDRGVDVSVYEQAEQLTEVGAGVALASNGTRLLRRLGVGDALASEASGSSHMIFRRRDGSLVAAHRLDDPYTERFGGPFQGLHRVALQRVLAAAMGDGVIHTGQRCVAVDSEAGAGGIRLRFEDGEDVVADVVVAADGVHSALRDQVGAGDDAVFSGTVGFRGVVPVEQLPSLPDPDAAQFWMGPGRHLLHYPIDGGARVNFLAVVRTPAWTSQRWMESCDPSEAAVAFEGWHPAATEMTSAVTEATRWALFDRRPLRHWSRGRLVLLGDAAHAMLPHQGQGANQTIEDAVVLADELAESSPTDVEAALVRYEQRRRRRTRRVQRVSRLTADLLHLPDGPEADARDLILVDLPNVLTWIHGHDAQAGSRSTATERVH